MQNGHVESFNGGEKISRWREEDNDERRTAVWAIARPTRLIRKYLA
jgi:hypothetical protein